MAEPTIICPKCKTEIKLTESLAAPIVESVRRDYEKRIAAKDVEIARKIQDERAHIAADEAQKAKRLLANDLAQKSREISDLQEVIKVREQKLSEAQKAQTY